MTTTTEEIIDLMNDDMVSHGLLEQCLVQANSGNELSSHGVSMAIKELLDTGKVAIGSARMIRPDYVEFVGLNGVTDAKIQRAMEAVKAASGPDKEFAYWLCLVDDVDRFEEEHH
jgi:hypothetical protein